MSKKKRPGVAAGIHLKDCANDPSMWRHVEEHGSKLADEIDKLAELEEEIQAAAGEDSGFITKKDLDTIVNWKFTVGKNRAFNRKYLDSNTDQTVRKQSKEAFDLAMQMNAEKSLNQEDGTLNETGRDQVKQSIEALTKLSGVGPATASAVLALVQPDFFAFMYDEAIDCLHPVRDYKLSTYLAVNSRCLELAQTLTTREERQPGKSDRTTVLRSWTPQRVAKALWTASRYNALHEVDLTIQNGGGSKEHEKLEAKDVAGEADENLPTCKSNKRLRRR